MKIDFDILVGFVMEPKEFLSIFFYFQICLWEQVLVKEHFGQYCTLRIEGTYIIKRKTDLPSSMPKFRLCNITLQCFGHTLSWHSGTHNLETSTISISHKELQMQTLF